ncbi:hypothetical protein FGG08_005761 [Glutinoglossum americanum]|uniref:PH domain-containing protein n=1 Tax=Glutinoglossum americanum TaxID=1670608 RepID=A0A9P8I6M9_9PEZI|nr:hypothetical protein FGG08_005761 [Glutinoglossum americanum]
MSATIPYNRVDAVPPLLDPVHNRAYGESSYGDAGAASNNPQMAYSLAQPAQQQQAQQAQLARFHEDFDASQRGSSILDDGEFHRAESQMSYTPSRGGALKKKGSLKKKSLRRNSSRRNSRAGSVASLLLGERERYADGEGDERNSAFYTPVPTSGSPTEILAHRFQAWRKVLKDLITYFREVQSSHENRSKSLLKLSNVCSNTECPPDFLNEGGISDTTYILRDFHKQAFAEASKAKDIQAGIIDQLSGLRNDLGLKIKEIKNLSGDFKNSVDKEMEATKKAVAGLQDALGDMESGVCHASGKGDPFIVKLAVDRQVERQINEENYLHTALLNLEASGRELESIVVGEIQKSYDTYAGILKREADEVYETIEKLRNGPLSLPRDYEWNKFVEGDDHIIDPMVPVRRAEDIEYPGRHHPAASEVREGMLERKSKYLKSYTPGWYVLSPSHLHEFKSHERLNDQSPVMSLFLPEQKLGSHSQPYSSSHKFMIKGRQTGAIHSRHSWVFRAESHDTMLAWYEDIKKLTEMSTRAERDAFVSSHRRTLSATSQKAGSVSSDGGLDEDEADQVPYSAASPMAQGAREPSQPRPQPGGRFPSELQVDRDLQTAQYASSGESLRDYEVIAAAAGLPGTSSPYGGGDHFLYDAEAVNEAEYPDPGTDRAGSLAPYQEILGNSDSARVDWVGSQRTPTGLTTTVDPTESYQTQTMPPPKQPPQRDRRPTPGPTSRPRSGVIDSAPVPPTTAVTASDVSTSITQEAMTTSQEIPGSTAPNAMDQTAGPNFPKSPRPRDLAGKAKSPPEREVVPVSARNKSVASISDMHVPGEYPPTPVVA